MELPIDLGKIKKLADDIQLDVDTTINVNVYIDKTSNADMQASLRLFFDESEKSVVYRYIDIDKLNLYLDNEPNFAVVIAGDSENSVFCYDALQINNVPALIISIKPQTIYEAASKNTIRVYKKDLICPSVHSYSYIYDDEGEAVIDFENYTESMDSSLKLYIVNYLYTLASEAEIAYASKFPFLRSKFATSLINTCAFENAGIGLIKIIPGADMPLMTLNQARMILQLAAIYGYAIDEDRIIEIITLVISAFAMRYLSDFVKKSTGIKGFLVDGATAFAATELLGKIAKEYFASGYAIDGLVDKVKTFVPFPQFGK